MKQGTYNALYILVMVGCVTILYGLRETQRGFIKDNYNIDIRAIRRQRSPIIFVFMLIICFLYYLDWVPTSLR